MSMKAVFKPGYLKFDAKFLHPNRNGMCNRVKQSIFNAGILEQSRVLTFEEGIDISRIQRTAGLRRRSPARAGVDGHPPADTQVHPQNQIQGVPGKRCEWLRIGMHEATGTGAIDDA
nr:hypothetical protein MTCCP1_00036 [uncultured bacterium]